MAKFVIAGPSDCPYFAKVELLGDCLAKNLPDFKLHKIVKNPSEWQEWSSQVCQSRGWPHTKSPLVWRELIDRGGKGVLIGGANEFQEYVQGYYNIKSTVTSHDMREIAAENCLSKVNLDQEEAEFKALSKPLRVAVTNAASPVCYSLLNRLACGEVFGHKEEIALRLHANPSQKENIEGLELEIQDLAHGLLRSVKFVPELAETFVDCSVIVLLDSPPQETEELLEDYVKRRGEYFRVVGQTIQASARKSVKILVASEGYVNLDTLMVIKGAPEIPRQNIVGLSRVIENAAKAVLGERLKVNSSAIRNLVVWGSADNNCYLDVSVARVHGYEGAIFGPPTFSLSVPEMVHDDKWLETDFVNQTYARRQAVETALRHAPAMSDAASIGTLLAHWWHGSPLMEFFSLAVYSEGWYDLPEDVVLSLPVTFDPKGYWIVVQDIDVSDQMKKKIGASVDAVVMQKEIIFPPPEESKRKKPLVVVMDSAADIVITVASAEKLAEPSQAENEELPAVAEEGLLGPHDARPEGDEEPADDEKAEGEVEGEGENAEPESTGEGTSPEEAAKE